MLFLRQLRKLEHMIRNDLARHREDITLLAMEELRQNSADANGKGRNPISLESLCHAFRKQTGRTIKPTDVPTLVQQARNRVDNMASELNQLGIDPSSSPDEPEAAVPVGAGTESVGA